MRKNLYKILLSAGILYFCFGIFSDVNAFSLSSIFHRKHSTVQNSEADSGANKSTETGNPDGQNTETPIMDSAVGTGRVGADLEDQNVEVIPIMDSGVNISGNMKVSFWNKYRFKNRNAKKNQDEIETDVSSEDVVELIEPKENKKHKKHKLSSEEKRYKNEHKLNKIELIIENEPYLNHDTQNEVYLDKYRRQELSTLKDFYKEKDIIENPDGTFNMVVKEDERAIDKLIDEIENSDSNDTFTPAVQLTLKECIGIALVKHPDILSAKLSTGTYKDRITQAWAAYFPNLSAGINYNRYHSKTDHYSYNYGSHYVPNVSAGLMLFDFGKTKTNVDIAKTYYEASQFNLESSINEVIYAVKSAYYNLLFAQKQIDVYQNTIEDFELQLKVAKKYFEIGKKPQIDVTMAEYNLGNAKLNLVKAINTLEVARVILANTIGLPAFSNFELADTLPVSEYETNLEILLTDAFRIRPDLLSQEKAVEAAYLGIRSAKRNYTPDLMANGTYYRGKVDKTDESNFQFGVDLTYSGLNLMQIKKENDIAKKEYESALADYEKAKQNVYMDVKQAYINLSNTKNTVKQAEMNVEQAKEQNYHATGRYNAGYGDAIELKDAENTYLNAQLEYYQALLEYNTEAANIERLVGRPLAVTENNL